MLSLVRSLGPLPGCFFFFWVLGLSHPWLYDADNRVANKIRKRLLCLFPVWNNERQWRGNRQSCTRPSALVFFLKSSVSQNWSRTGPNCKEGSHKPKLDMQNSQSLLLFFFPTKNAWSFWAKRLDEKNQIGKRVERQMAKLESICLGNGKNGCRARPATSTTPTKTPKQPPQQLTADQISKLQLRWHPYALKEYRITVSCSDSWADTAWAKRAWAKWVRTCPIFFFTACCDQDT